MDLTVKIAGEAGQGIQTIGTLICRSVKRHGLNIFATHDYMSMIRGGNNFFCIRISDNQKRALKATTDILVALNRQSVQIHEGTLTDTALVITDAATDGARKGNRTMLAVPFKELAKKATGILLYENAIACGVVTGVLHLEQAIVERVVEEVFLAKGVDVVEKNRAAMLEGYRFALNNHTSESVHLVRMIADNRRVIIDGSQAVALGAMHAGCRFFSAYPMSPSTGIMNMLAKYARSLGIVVEQAEDEIAAINMIIGASFAGVRAMTATSGGGFALMGEGLSLATMTETPVVVVDAQRPAPATGLPTRTEQADLDFLLHAGHGEFARIVYSPGSAEELYFCTVKAFDLAEKYQVPVLIMTDQFLADTLCDVVLPDTVSIPRKRYLVGTADAALPYKRYAFSESGISPRAVPGCIDDVLYADSDEHTEEGHITEDATLRTRMVNKRFKNKLDLLAQEIIGPVIAVPDDVAIILIGFGSTHQTVAEVVEVTSGIRMGYVHLPQVWPFPTGKLVEIFASHPNAKIVSVENNAAGQLARLLRRETGILCHDSILKYDGRPFNVDEIVTIVRERFILK